MRVLTIGNMYPPHHLGGYELMWRSSIAHLRERGHDARVLTTDYRNPSSDADTGQDADVRRQLRWYWRDHEFPRLGPRERLRLERHNLGVLDHHLQEFAPDVVCWWAMGGMSMSLVEAVHRRGIPAVAAVVDEWLLYGPKVDQWQRVARRAGPLGPIVERLTGVPARLDFDMPTRWVFASEMLLGDARGAGWLLPHATVAHAGIDRSLFPERPPAPWGGRLLYLGRLDRRKGVDVAIRALTELPGATLTVVGGGDEEYLGELRSLVAALGLDERVTFERRSREDVPAAYSDSDALLFPVLWEEPWGLVPLEAMATGVPVVATGTGGSGEYLSDGRNCLIYAPPDDPGALAAAVRRLAEDPDLRANLRGGGLETAERFDEGTFNDAVLAALQEVVEA